MNIFDEAEHGSLYEVILKEVSEDFDNLNQATATDIKVIKERYKARCICKCASIYA